MSFGFFEIFATALAAIYTVVRSYGASIILLTVVIRLLLLPLSIKQTKSMREMQRIQPEVKRLQAKHKGDRQKLNTEMMALYKEHGVNPFGGCAPLLLQFPVLIGLYWVIKQPLQYMTGIKGWALPQALALPPEHAVQAYRFLGLRLDCSAATARAGQGSQALAGVSCGSGLASAIPYIALIAVMGFTTFYQQRQMQSVQAAGGAQAQQMQVITKVMPVFLMFIGFSFPAALVMYWTVTNVWTIAQQRLMLGKLPPMVTRPGDKGDQGDKEGTKQAGDGRAPSGKSAKAPKPSSGKPPAKARGNTGDGRKAPAASSPSSKRKRRK